MPTLTVSGTISFPIAAESTPPSRSFSFTLNYTKKVTKDLELTGAQVDVDLLDGIADAKAVYVECLVGSGTLEANAATAGSDVTAGNGFYAWFNPDGGLTTFTVTTGADATFRYYIFS